MVFVEPDLAGVELTDAALNDLELRLHLLRLGRRFLDADAQPGHRLVDRFDTGTHGVDLSGQSRQAFAAVGFGAHGGQVGAFGFRGDALALRQFGAGRLQPGARLRQLVEQLPLLRGDLVGLGVKGFGIGTARCLRLGLEVLRALAGDTHRRADAFGERRQPEPGLLRGLGALAERVDRCFVGVQFDGFRVEPGGGLVVLAAQGGLGLVGVVELGLTDDQVVGGQPEPGVAEVGLDGLGATGHLGLAAQRLELSAQLGRQVGQPGEVRRHRVELADRLLLALAVLEDACGLLDERAPVLRPRLEDLVELALTDDDVHLATDARVGEQLLHIHQTATGAVDFVLAAAVAEHPAGDRHLGVLDRQRVVGVVDRHGHLGAAQRSP